MAGQPELYKKEIFNFLRTCTIKFEPFAYLMGQDYMNKHGLTNPHGRWNPYYINLSGDYAEGDERMYVYSPEVDSQIPFDNEMIIHYPKTATLYKIPNREYTTLCERYPRNLGLIKAIAYPVPDIDAAINAPNLSLLAYDENLLEANERESLVSALKNFLKMVRTRWWLEEFVYEDMFAVTFWGMLWQYLPTLLLTQRFLNIRTGSVHSFHIWEYLKSRGLNDYRDVLSLNQSLWLYRNIDYILKNKGKNDNLIKLADNLLKEVFVSLLYKDMYQNTSTLKETCRTIPQFRSFNMITDEEVKQESLSGLTSRMVDSGIEYRDDSDYIAKNEKNLGEIGYNDLSTKFLEFKKDPLNTSGLYLLTNFLLDTLTYRLSTKDLPYELTVKIPLMTGETKLYVGDAFLLWHWAIYRSAGITPTTLPTTFDSVMAFKKDKPLVVDVEKYLYWNNDKHLIRSHVDVLGLIQGNDWHARTFSNASQFTDHILSQYSHYLNIKKQSEQSNKLLYHLCLKKALGDITVNGPITIDFGTAKTYQEWFKNTPAINAIIGTYEDSQDQVYIYRELGKKLFDTIFPIDYEKWKNVIGASRNIEKIYTSIRDLFIQLCSYNVTYLENEREEREYSTMLMYDIYENGFQYDLKDYWNLVFPGCDFNLGLGQGYPKMWVTWPEIIDYIYLRGLIVWSYDLDFRLNLPIDLRVELILDSAFRASQGYTLGLKYKDETQHHRIKLNLHPGTHKLSIKEV